MVDPRRTFGNDAEALAASYLTGKGMRILATQFRTRMGEIDLIAEDGSEIVFVEVKARRSRAFGYPEESVTPKKIEKIAAAGEVYLRKTAQEHRPFRIDVVAIEGNFRPPRLLHIRAVG